MFTLTRLYILLGLVALLGLGVWYVRHQGVVAERAAAAARAAAQYRADAEAAHAMAKELEKSLEAIRVFNQDLKEKLDAELDKDPVYRNCRLPAGGVQLLNRALAGPAPR